MMTPHRQLGGGEQTSTGGRAWHVVHGKLSPRKPSRTSSYARIQSTSATSFVRPALRLKCLKCGADDPNFFTSLFTEWKSPMARALRFATDHRRYFPSFLGAAASSFTFGESGSSGSAAASETGMILFFIDLYFGLSTAVAVRSRRETRWNSSISPRDLSVLPPFEIFTTVSRFAAFPRFPFSFSAASEMASLNAM